VTRHLSIVFAITLTVGAGAPLVGAQSRDGAVPASPEGTARLAGRVFDALDLKQPIRRAIVTITGSQIPAGRSAITDDEGRFVFERVATGQVMLSVTRAGFLRAVYGAAQYGRAGTPVTVRAGADVLDLVVPMTHGSALSGTLRDAVGDLAPNMRVEAIRVRRGAAGERAESVGSALTDDRGEFRIYGLPAGDYVLAATPAFFAGVGDIGAASEAEVDATLAALQRRASTQPTPGVPPQPMPKQKGFAVPPSFYPGVLQAGDATRVTLGASDDRSRLDFAMVLSHAASIDGVIAPIRGQDVPTVTVGLNGGGPALPIAGGSASGPGLSWNTRMHTFHVANAAPGHYRLMARSFGAPGGSSSVISGGGALPQADLSGGVQWALAVVDLAGDDITGVTLQLQPALRVRGRLAFDATQTTPPADPSTLRIALDPVADDFGPATLTSPIAAVIQRDGTFEFPALIPGRYRVTTSPGGSGWWLRSALVNTAGGKIDVLDGGLQLGTADLADVVLTLSDRHTAIDGSLSNTTGRPAPDYFMVAFATDRAMWRTPSRRVVSTRPSTSGAFEIKDLPPGTYYLAALTDVEAGDLDDAEFLQSLVTASLTVTVTEGQTTRQDVRIGG
jgi:hypothetical protein